MASTTNPRRRMTRNSDATAPGPADKSPSKLDRLEGLLLAGDGATIAAMMDATGWQQHSVRGAIAGALKRRGLVITSQKIAGLRCYRAVRR